MGRSWLQLRLLLATARRFEWDDFELGSHISTHAMISVQYLYSDLPNHSLRSLIYILLYCSCMIVLSIRSVLISVT